MIEIMREDTASKFLENTNFKARNDGMNSRFFHILFVACDWSNK